MELQFKKQLHSCLDTVLDEVRNQERTLEIKLTDSMPDVGRILSAWGQPVLRSKEWRAGEVSASGGMMVWVLYAPEDGTGARCLDGWVPFQFRWDIPEEAPEGSLRISLLPRFVDARSVSARKILVRAGLSAMVQAHSPMEAEIYTPDTVPEGVELLRRTYPVRLPKEAGEKSFLMDEDLTLPPSAPEPEKLVYFSVRPQITDRKVLGNKLVFRGNGNLHVLYISEEGQLHSWDFDLPFSQFAELRDSFSTDSQADVQLCPTTLEAELDDEGHLRLKCGLVGQYLVDDQQMLELTEDAYSPGRELALQSRMITLPAILDSRWENIYGEQTIPAEANIVVDMAFLPEFSRQRRTERGIAMEMPGMVQLLYYAPDGSLQSANARWEGRQELPVDGETAVTVLPQGAAAELIPGSGSMVLKGEVPVQVTTAGGGALPMVTGLELGEALPPDTQRPSLILRRAGETGLWELAKASGSTMEAIRKANGLDSDPAPGRMLLIPVGG